MLDAADGNRFAAFAATPEEPSRRRRRDPARRARPLPLLRGARAALRRARLSRRSRSTTSGARPASASATTTSPTWSTSRRRRRTASRPTSAPRSPTCARPRAARARAIFTVGFCFGGRNSWLAVGRRPRPRRRGRLLRHAGRAQRPARADRSAPRDRARRSSRSRRAPTRTSPPTTTPRSTRALAAAGVEHEVVTFDGAPHSFFDRLHEEFQAAVRRRLAAHARVHRRAPLSTVRASGGSQRVAAGSQRSQRRRRSAHPVRRRSHARPTTRAEGSTDEHDRVTRRRRRGAPCGAAHARGRRRRSRWVRPALFALLALTALAYLWDLGASGDANSFYAAAVAGRHEELEGVLLRLARLLELHHRRQAAGVALGDGAVGPDLRLQQLEHARAAGARGRRRRRRCSTRRCGAGSGPPPASPPARCSRSRRSRR